MIFSWSPHLSPRRPSSDALFKSSHELRIACSGHSELATRSLALVVKRRSDRQCECCRPTPPVMPVPPAVLIPTPPVAMPIFDPLSFRSRPKNARPPCPRHATTSAMMSSSVIAAGRRLRKFAQTFSSHSLLMSGCSCPIIGGGIAGGGGAGGGVAATGGGAAGGGC